MGQDLWLFYTILYPSLQIIALTCSLVALRNLNQRKVKNLGTQFGQILVICSSLYHLVLLILSLLVQLLPLPPYGPIQPELVRKLCFFAFFHANLTVASFCILSGIFLYVNLVIELLKNGLLNIPWWVVLVFTSKRLVYLVMGCIVLAVSISLALDWYSIYVPELTYAAIQGLGLPILLISGIVLVVTLLQLMKMKRIPESRALVFSILRLLSGSIILLFVMLLGLFKSINIILNPETSQINFPADPHSFQSSPVIYFFLGPALLLVFRSGSSSKKSDKPLTIIERDTKKSHFLEAK